jgi:hypothetical protein
MSAAGSLAVLLHCFCFSVISWIGIVCVAFEAPTDACNPSFAEKPNAVFVLGWGSSLFEGMPPSADAEEKLMERISSIP